MEDAATAEISRTQIWQWKKHNITLDNSVQVTNEYIKTVLDEELSDEKGTKAREIFDNFCLSNKLDDFLTLDAYKEL
jgi:malate synthase